MSTELPPNSLIPQKPISQFRLLLWLKWTLIIRAFGRRKANFLVVGLLFLSSCLFSVILYIAGRSFPALLEPLSETVYGFVYLIWILAPLLGVAMNESYDVGRLFIYPVSLRTIFAANTVGGFFEFTTACAIPFLCVPVILSNASPTAVLFAIVAAAIFMLQAIATAQLIILLLSGLLQSRKFRDITIVVIPIISLFFAFGQQIFIHQLNSDNLGHFLSLPLWSYLSWLPSGWAVGVYENAEYASFAASFGYLLLLVIATAIPVSASSLVMRGLYTGDRGPTNVRKNEQQTDERLAGIKFSLFGNDWLPRYRPISALISKDLAYLKRDPRYKALAVSTVYIIGISSFSFFMNSRQHVYYTFFDDDSTSGFYQALVLLKSFGLPTLMIYCSLAINFNIFGIDDTAITCMFSFPVQRMEYIIAKNIIYGSVTLGLGVLGIALEILVLHQHVLLWASLVWLLLACPVILAIGNIVSILIPHKMTVRGQSYGKGGKATYGISGAQGCSMALIGLLWFVLSILAAVPAGAAIIVPMLTEQIWLCWITIPIAAVYSILTYVGCLFYASNLLEKREQSVIDKLNFEI